MTLTHNYGGSKVVHPVLCFSFHKQANRLSACWLHYTDFGLTDKINIIKTYDSRV